MDTLDRIIIISEDEQTQLNYEKYVTNKDGVSGIGIQPISDIPIITCSDLNTVKSCLEENGFLIREEFQQRLEEVYEGALAKKEPLNILVVDDDDWVYNYLKHSLPFHRYRLHDLDNEKQALVLIPDNYRLVDTASNANDALQLFKEKNHQIVLTDLWMPEPHFKEKNSDWAKTSILERASDEELKEGSQGMKLIEDIWDYIEDSDASTTKIIPFSSQWEHRRIRDLFAKRIYRKSGVGILPKHYSFDFEQRSTFDDVLESILISPQMLNYIYNSFLSTLRFAIREMRERKRVINDLTIARTEIIGQSEEILEIVNLVVNRIAPATSTVLITGESGTGKELVAKLIHKFSRRSNGPFVTVDCSNLPSTLIEEELFGHEKGSFTGATSEKKGLFEVANGGTLFLDEIGELDITLQSKLLRVLQERRIRRVGGTREIKVEVRLVAATNRDLLKMLQEGHFREDLYYRLNVLSIEIPPLRMRRKDILPLIQHFLQKYSEQFKKELYIDSQAEKLLVEYDWKGNVRELQNAIERASVLGDLVIFPKDLPPQIREHPNLRLSDNNSAANQRGTKNFQIYLEGHERELIIDALYEAGNNKSKAAKLLHISRTTLDKRLKKYNIKINKDLEESG